jgi:hypothetical protein
MIRWVNFYPPCDDTTGAHPWRTTSWLTKELANQHANPGRLACIGVAFAEGEGLAVGGPIDLRAMAGALGLSAAHAAAIVANAGYEAERARRINTAAEVVLALVHNLPRPEAHEAVDKVFDALAAAETGAKR